MLISFKNIFLQNRWYGCAKVLWCSSVYSLVRLFVGPGQNCSKLSFYYGRPYLYFLVVDATYIPDISYQSHFTNENHN